MEGSTESIHLEGVRQNNLKGFNLTIPRNKLIVITGMSGSGKSSLAFDTLFAEGQRRYVETFTPYARQFFDRMDKPKVDRISGIPPSIAIEQRNSVKTTRSTVGTMTEIMDYLKVLWPHVTKLICPNCEIEIADEHPAKIWEYLTGFHEGRRIIVGFDINVSEGFSADETRELLNRQGFQRVLRLDDQSGAWGVVRIEELGDQISEAGTLTIVQDRLDVVAGKRNRFLDSAAAAAKFGRNRLKIFEALDPDKRDTGWQLVREFSRSTTCGQCGHTNAPARASLFNFNHPTGACPGCNGFGRVIRIDYRLAIPDQQLSIKEGAVRPWRGGTGAGCQKDLVKFCQRAGIDMSRPFSDLPKNHRRLVIEGEPGYGEKGPKNRWPHKWYGIKGFFDWLETKSYKMHVRVLLSKYRVYIPCEACGGKRLKQDALNFRMLPENSGTGRGLDISQFMDLTVESALNYAGQWLDKSTWERTSPVRLAAEETFRRLRFLDQVGLGYLHLNRPTRTLSGGETERVSLTACLGSRLVNTLFILDEPSVGLHPRDTARLIEILKDLRDTGNTVVVVEHEAMVMEAADRVVDLGPTHGADGGEIAFEGSFPELLSAGQSLTAQYLTGKKKFPEPDHQQKFTAKSPRLKLTGATCHNLKNLEVEFPLQRMVAVTGVSGSGKTTLIRSCLLKALGGSGQFPGLSGEIENDSDLDELPDDLAESGKSGDSMKIKGLEHLRDVLFVDQSILGKTPRSNPAVYTKAFEPIRKLMALTPDAKERELTHSAFSFNSQVGQCEKCTGAGYEKIEMQFLSDVYVQCPECLGRRYRNHVLDIFIDNGMKKWNVADFLESTVDETLEFLGHLPESTNSKKAIRCLEPLREIGLGYLKLGQPINTLSGGESQRLKLVRSLNELKPPRGTENSTADKKGQGILFLFDEPTTGLHFEDIRMLLELFNRIVRDGHSIIFIEHNLEMIQAADWVIDMGPEAGEDGGKINFSGPPADLVKSPTSHTGKALRNSRFYKPADSSKKKSKSKTSTKPKSKA